jgi:hypothetical protein
MEPLVESPADRLRDQHPASGMAPDLENIFLFRDNFSAKGGGSAGQQSPAIPEEKAVN